VEVIMVIGHYDCAMQGFEPETLARKMLARNIKKEEIEMMSYCGQDIKKWLKGFDNTEESIAKTAEVIRNHPLMPKDVQVYGFIIDPATGKLDEIC